MGVNLKEIIPNSAIRVVNDLKELAGKTVAIDAYNALYQFLSAIRQPDGTPLMDSKGRITSHLSGLFYRTINLVEAGIKPVYVFDGKAPEIKAAEIIKRRSMKTEAERKYLEAVSRGDIEEMRKYAQATSKLTSDMIESSKRLLTYMGIPWIQAPSEGEAQAAYLVIKGDAWATVSQDYDSLLFGSIRLVRNLTISGKRKLPGKDVYVELRPEIIDLNKLLSSLGLSREQLIDLAIVIGTDYNPDGIKGIGPKTALNLVKSYKSIERIAKAIPGAKFPVDPLKIRDFFLNPPVTDNYEIKWSKPDINGVIKLLVDEYDFSYERVKNNLDRLVKSMDKIQATKGKGLLDQWFKKKP